MDNEVLLSFIQKIPKLAKLYCGSVPPDRNQTNLKPNSFQIVNTDLGYGEHWVVFICDAKGNHYFGDSLGQSLSSYKNLKYSKPTIQIVNQPSGVQDHPEVCGVFAVYFAYLVLITGQVTPNKKQDMLLTEPYLFRFISRYIHL